MRSTPRTKSASVAPAPAGEMMDTREVAAYLRLKERRIYALVRENAMPHVRATGKLLFPREPPGLFRSGRFQRKF